jgi:hypothetical protein
MFEDLPQGWHKKTVTTTAFIDTTQEGKLIASELPVTPTKIAAYPTRLYRTIGRNLGDQNPVTPLFFCPEESTVRRSEEFHSCGSVVR